jgi:hypothetical protein
MRCKYCNAKLAQHDIWCVECGKQTEVVKKDLSALGSLAQTYRKYRPEMATAVPGAAFAVICGVIPILVLIWMFNSIISLESTTALKMLISLGIKAVSISIFVPFVLIGFKAISQSTSYHISLKDMLSALKAYPRYLGFTLISAFFYALFYVVCFGLPNFGSLPILRLVWIVLVNYWVAIVLPAPVLMELHNLSPWAAVKKSYRHFHDVRWNTYLLALCLVLLNMAATVLLLFPLIFTLPLSLFAIRDYTNRLIEFELLDYRR